MTPKDEKIIAGLADSLASVPSVSETERATLRSLLLQTLRRTFMMGRGSAMTEAFGIAVEGLDGSKFEICRLLQEASNRAIKEVNT